ncbi:tyrosine-protein phosphatase [Sanguibacter suarezii]|uniref:tyrosine-protein phosphatase n=1 Tax=Sanguibacter suarezii TaxID=60921 RepID=UPI000836D5BB|nr:tyrosine-protein phosphatase [Sanguibacter suarezii]
MTDKLMTDRETGTTGPALDIPGTWNARDVGGRAVPEGSSVPLATGVLLRTASLAALQPAGVAVLDDYDVRTVLDLRSPQEVARDGADVVPASTQVLSLPFGTPHPEKAPALADGEDDALPVPQAPAEATGEVASEVAGADMARVLATLVGSGVAATADPAELGQAIMTGIYRRFVTDPAAHEAVGTALTAIASSTHAVLVHCSAGKDRTGWIVALAQAVCSVPSDQILQEYLLSAGAATELAAAMPVIPGVDAALWEAVLTVRPEYLAAAHEEVERSYGSLTAYLDAIGVDADLRALLRARFGVAPA